MGVAGRLAGDGAQAESLGGVEAGGFQLPIVPAQRLALGVFKIELPIVGTVQGVLHDAFHAGAVHAGAVEEEIVGDGKRAHENSEPVMGRNPVCPA